MTNDDDQSDVEIEWFVPGSESSSTRHQQLRENRIRRCMESAKACDRDFDSSFTMHSVEREGSIPHFYPNELVLLHEENDEQHLIRRVYGYFKEFVLQNIDLDNDENKVDPCKNGKLKRRFTSQNKDHYEYYSVKYLQDGILESDHGLNAATEIILEVKILMSLAQHPNIARLYGKTTSGMGSLPMYGTDGYFFITDRILETLDERMIKWRDKQNAMSTTNDATPTITRRLEIALDIASALVFLHDRQLVYYIRPDKVGFDVRYGVVKLCNFGQSRQQGMESHPRSIAQSDCIHTLAYTAPELFCMSPAHTASDVFGFGVMLWEMMSLQHPFSGYDRAKHFEEVVRQNRRPLQINQDWDKAIAAMIKRCWEPHKRPSIKKVHEEIETRLLYQEPTNEIVDTALIIQRRRSESERRHSESTTFSHGKGSNLIDDKSIAEALRRSTNISYEKENYVEGCTPNGSTSSLLSGVGLDEMLIEVSNSLTAGSSEPFTDAHQNVKRRQNQSDGVVPKGSRGRRNSRTRASKVVRRPSENDEIKKSNSDTNRNVSRQPTALDIKLGSSARILVDMDVASVDDDEDLIASIMSQSDISGRKGPSVSSSKTDHSDRMTQLRTEIRRSISAQRSKSQMRPRKRSTSRGREKTARKEFPTEDTEPVTPPPTPPRKKIEKPSPKLSSIKSAPRTSLQGSLSKIEIPPILPRRFSMNSFGRSNSDSSLAIPRNRRASVAEVKQKFDFVPDTPKTKSHTNSIRILQKSLETASPIKSQPVDVTASPTKKMANVGKRLLRGVLRRHSLKNEDEDMEPATPIPATRSTTRRPSSSFVVDIVKTPGQPTRPTVRRGSSSLVLDIVKQQSSLQPQVVAGKKTLLEKANATQGRKGHNR